MVLADHLVWKYKDALEETRSANYSTAKFLKVRCSIITVYALISPYLMQTWDYSNLLKGNKNNSEWMMPQSPGLVLTYSSVFLCPWVFENAKALSKSALKQFWFIHIYSLKEPKFSNFADSYITSKWVKSLVRNETVVTAEQVFFFTYYSSEWLFPNHNQSGWLLQTRISKLQVLCEILQPTFLTL